MKKLGRRSFLQLSGAALGALLFSPENAHSSDAVEVPDVPELASTPLAYQLDVPGGFFPYITLPNESFLDLAAGNSDLSRKLSFTNGYYPLNPETAIPPRSFLLLPLHQDLNCLPTPGKEVIQNTSGHVEFRLVDRPNTQPFTRLEYELFGREIRDFIVPKLDQFLGTPAIRGLVQIGRLSTSEISDYDQRYPYTKGADGFMDTNFFPIESVHAQYFSRNSAGIMANRVNEGKVLASKIFIKNTVPEDIFELVSSHKINLMDPRFGEYCRRVFRELAHECAHIYLPPQYQLPPFDNHNIVRAVSIGIDRELTRTKGGGWSPEGVKEDSWNMPEFQLLLAHHEFFKDLLSLLKKEEPTRTSFSESEVIGAMSVIFAKNPKLAELGSATSWLKAQGLTSNSKTFR